MRILALCSIQETNKANMSPRMAVARLGRPATLGAAPKHEEVPTAMRVLRLCSVFEPPTSSIAGKGASFDPIGGMQNHTAQLTRALDRRGVVQTVVTTRPPTAPRLQRLGNYARVIRLGLPVRRFRQLYGPQVGVLAPILAVRTDLVHVHLGEDLAILPVGMAAAKLRGLPLVLTVHMSLNHTLIVTDFRSAVLKTFGGPIERWGERSADAVLVITPRLARQLVSEGVEEERVHVIPPGVNSALFSGPFEDPFPSIGRPRVVFVGRLAPQKGVRTLVEATRLIRAPGAQVLLIGDGPQRATLEQAVQRLGVGDVVHFFGFVPHERVPAVLAHADLLVLPSLYEELGTILLEAMWMSVPIVASRTGGIPDIIDDGVNGLLVLPGDSAALARAIDRVLSSPDLARRLGKAAQEQAKGYYDWEVLAERVLEAYRGVTAGRS
jgi:glycosyltransferase involved in cell wall biosynthesis